MSLRLLSVVAIVAKLLAVLPVAEAQSTGAKCSTGFDWTTNSRGQNPCLIAAYLEGACAGGDFTVDPLLPGTHYTGPTAAQQNGCQCSTVSYSLVSACSLCQNRTYISWSSWSANCTQVYISQYPEQIPLGTSVPNYAFLDVVTADGFNQVAAQADSTAPESSGTATKQTGTISNTGSSTATSVGQVSSTPSSGGATSGSASKKSNAGAIAGGVVGGLVLLGLIAGLIAFFVIRSRRAKNAPSTEYSAYGNGQNGPPNSPPLMSQHSYNQNPHDVNQPQQLYNPEDPTTWPSRDGVATPTIHTTNSGPSPHPFKQQPGHYSGVPEV